MQQGAVVDQRAGAPAPVGGNPAVLVDDVDVVEAVDEAMEVAGEGSGGFGQDSRSYWWKQYPNGRRRRTRRRTSPRPW